MGGAWRQRALLTKGDEGYISRVVRAHQNRKDTPMSVLIASVANADLGFALFGLIFGVAIGNTGDCRRCRSRRRREQLRYSRRVEERNESIRKPW